MQCEEARIHLVAYLDGELPAEEEEEIRTHLHACADCRSEQSHLSLTGDMLSRIGGREKSRVDFATTVLEIVTSAPSENASASSGQPAWCRHIRKELVAYLDGELSETDARPVREHLQECSACRAEERDLEASSDLLSLWKVPATGTDLVPRIPVSAAPPSRRRSLLLLPSLAAAACVVAIAAFLSVRPDRPAPDQPPRELLLHLDLIESMDVLDHAHNGHGREFENSLELLDTLTPDDIAMLYGGGGG